MDIYKSWKVINRGDECNLKDVEVGIKNKFNWSWLEKALTLKVKIGSREEDVLKVSRHFPVYFVRTFFEKK